MPDLPIACALSPDELRAGADSLLPSLLGAARVLTALPNGILMELEASTEMLRHIAEVIERERSCCPFFRFQVDIPPRGEGFVMTVTGPDGTGDLLAGLAAVGISTNPDMTLPA